MNISAGDVVPQLSPLPPLQTLADCEQVIARGLQTFLEVGQALRVVQTNRLYRAAGYATWADYLSRRWGISPQRASQVMGASDTALSVGDAAGELNEAQARALRRVDEALRPLVLDVARLAAQQAGVAFSSTHIPRALEVVQEVAATGAVTVDDEQFPIGDVVVGQVAREIQEARLRQKAHIEAARPSSPVFKGTVTASSCRLLIDVPSDGEYMVIVYSMPKEAKDG